MKKDAHATLRSLALALAALMAGMHVPQLARAGAFVPTGSLQEARRDHTATRLLNGKVLVAGGYVTNALVSAELYDPVAETWTQTDSLNTQRYYHTATLLLNGKVLVAGGEGVSGRSLTGAELYDPAAGTWTVTGSLNLARDEHTATLLHNGKVLVVGGERYDGTNTFWLPSAELYDPATGLWTVTGTLHDPRVYHTATLLADGKVLVAAGGNLVDGYLNRAELYDPATGVWTVTGSLTEGRNYHSSILLLNGQVLVAGGAIAGGFYGRPIAGAELYDPVNGTWTPTGSLNIERASQTVSLLANGRVLVAGGGGLVLFLPLSSAEEYDPAIGVWGLTGSMTTNRSSHTANLLANGKVLVAGGSFSPTLSSAELYDSGAAFVPQPVRLTNYRILPDGAFQFSFTNTPGALFSVLGATNAALPFTSWTELGVAMEFVPGQFQFTDTQATNHARRFYGLRQ